MKKMSAVIMSLCVLSAAAAMAVDPVYSVNIVGYANVSVPTNNLYALTGINFRDIGGGGMTLLEIFGTNQLKKSQLTGQADKVLLWDVDGQKYVSYAQKTNGNFYALIGWTTNAPATNVIASGTALWIQSVVSSARTVAVAGEVPTDGAMTNYIYGNSSYPYYLICNPYPVAVDIQDFINTNNGARSSGLTGQADKMTLWDPVGQKYITLGLKSDNKWHLLTGWTTNAPYVGKIAVGEGAFFQSKTNITWVINKPF